ncbi:unnamed protein product [Caenorhabditis sp. 36 PRJEB53466]|nr:unnamed protein product [Caenorhabditis sp. 36 PRJEB53466]
MLAARGVSLGLGKINLSDLNQLPQDRILAAHLKKSIDAKNKKPKIIIKKKADAKTVWAACRAVIFGCIIIVVGLAMTVLGYFDKYFSEKIEIIDGSEHVTYDRMVQYQLKSMQYLGPILMGIGSFILIIACVVTLESRDKHAQIITEESILQKRRRLLSEEEKAEHNDVFIDDDDDKEAFFGDGRRFVALDANRLAPLADVDSLGDISLTQRGGSDSRLHSEEVCMEDQYTFDHEQGEEEEEVEDEPFPQDPLPPPSLIVECSESSANRREVPTEEMPSKPKRLRLEMLAAELD